MLIGPQFKLRDGIFLACMLALFALPILVRLSTPTYLQSIQEGGTLRVVTRVSPATYFQQSRLPLGEDARQEEDSTQEAETLKEAEANDQTAQIENTDEQPAGFEYELSKRFADALGVELEIITVDSLEDLENALRLENAHLAAASLTQTAERKQRFDFGPAYLHSSQLLIYKNGRNQAPKTIGDLADKQIGVMANSSHALRLQELLWENTGLRWQEDSELEVLDLLKQVDDGELDYTLIDSHEFEINQIYFPKLKSAFAVSQSQPIAWMLKQRPDQSLQRALAQFFAQPETQELLESLKEQYFNREERLGLVDSLTFQKHMRSRLPRYLDWFIEAEEETGIDWKLLAAIGYQESHWNPRAVSPTGVRGLMMLTRNTAKEMGIKKRTDAQQSIQGGARYFAKTLQRIPERISEPDRTWLALAAYNVGLGHLEDARILAQRAGQNPDRWESIERQLPKLANPRWYKTLKYGFARGYEPVVYVRNIRRYLKRLEWEAHYQAVIQGQRPSEASPQVVLRDLPDTL